MFDLPLFLKTSGLSAIVVGGGVVGIRKAKMLLAAGSNVRVVSTTPMPDEFRHESRLEWIVESYRAEHLDGVRLVFTAAPHEVCAQVQADANARGLLVCRADDFEKGDFITPIALDRGRQFKIAVSTGGASPILARRVRDRLGDLFDETFGQWVDLLELWRTRSGAAIWESPDGKHEFLERICEWSWLDRFRSEGKEAVSQAYSGLATQLGLRESIM